MPIAPGVPIDATRLWQRSEVPIHGWSDLRNKIDELSLLYPHNQFVWRGQADASWGMESSLARHLRNLDKIPPAESDLVAAEAELLHRARIDWRLDGIPALPLLAQMQHVGAPTRLLDVTFNPLIAAWFAVHHYESRAKDGRLIVFASRKGPLQLNSRWNSNRPRWHDLRNDTERRHVDWGTGVGRKVWRPPALHARIPAQNAAFILDGAPVFSGTTELGMDASQMREFSSVPLRLAKIDASRPSEEDAPVFTYLIAAIAKREIRRQIQDRFGYDVASIYPDIEGFAAWSRRWRPGAPL